MASHTLNPAKRMRQPTLFDTFGYGSKPERPSSFTTAMVSLAVIFHFGLLPILWQEVPSVPSIVWTGASTALLALTALAARHSSISIRWTTTATLLFFIAYPLFAWISYKAWGQYSTEREGLLLQLVPIMFLGLLLYFMGAAARSHRVFRAFGITWLIIAIYTLAHATSFDRVGLAESSTETGVKLNYQLMGDAFAICSTILAPRIRQSLWQWIFMLVSIGIMFIIPSRSAAFFGVVALMSIPFMFSSAFFRVMVIVLALAAYGGYKTGVFFI